MPGKKPKKRKSKTAKRAAAVLAAASVGTACALGHDDKHIEQKENQPRLTIALLTDATIVATPTVTSTVMLTRGTFSGKLE
jgi:hypothetical protein